MRTTSSPDYDRGFYVGQQTSSLESAREVVPIVMDLIQPKTVVDVGCGLGTWLSVFAELGVMEYLGIDGSYVPADMLLIPRDRFRAHDLKLPLEVANRYDLAVSLEVAEHLPASCAAAFVDSLTNLAPVVLFSAAVPFQGGTRHVNEQWPEYWAGLFSRCGFEPVDCLRRRVWRNPNVCWWYAQNALLYVRNDLLENRPDLRGEQVGGDNRPLALIHPSYYLQWADVKGVSLRRYLWLVAKLAQALPSQFASGVSTCVRRLRSRKQAQRGRS
ncbi:MAG TPA: methyltransferase domain-containing protein [Sedimentisphaerales bacterium]|mgnify:FL=1|nr:methyltransferase domain-containing protein [Sedimentisphaerales bacterium]